MVTATPTPQIALFQQPGLAQLQESLNKWLHKAKQAKHEIVDIKYNTTVFVVNNKINETHSVLIHYNIYV